MKPIRRFTVVPSFPESLKPLHELALNLWWCWDHEAITLFHHLDSELWEAAYHNPVVMLGIISQERLEAAAQDEAFLEHLDSVYRKLDAYMAAPSWFGSGFRGNGLEDLSIAYFSAEFGITECLPLYSGGLGVLSGDHLKSSSYLGLPLVGVGLLYQHGYFRQQLDLEGWQIASYPANDFYNMPIQLMRRADDSPVMVTVDYPEGRAYAQVWRVQVGRIPLYLLDTNTPENTTPNLRDITAYLYGGDSRMRIRQEMLLGIGGYRALIELGIHPTVCHMNEGHSAFLAIERIRQLMEQQGLGFDEACEATTAGNIFTTHTPVPAGIDIFPADLVDSHFSNYYAALGISREAFLALGQENASDVNNGFSMAVLALRLSAFCNGVSQIHGKVSRNMWKAFWPELPENEVPIQSVTNGIHTRSWISSDMKGLFDRYLGPRWIESLPTDESIWTQVDRIPQTELWRTHERRRERLVAFARRRLRQQLIRVSASPAEIRVTDEILNPEVLTIGFARRFATYKRATLLFRNPERLAQILNHPDRPVQVIFAGKAHPHDHEGKVLIQEICRLALRDDRFRYKIIFIEDYDICVARYLVQGVDVWLNTPLPPFEASGTSGMKAAANGVLNLSVPDGWWAEGYQFGGGWTIGQGEVYSDLEYQNKVEANAIYDTLEQEIVPMFYNRGRDDIPHQWVNQMKLALRNLAPIFNTKRMVSEYAERFYFPAHQRWQRLSEDNARRGKALAQWKAHLRQEWSKIRVDRVEDHPSVEFQAGENLWIKAHVYLGAISPKEVDVQLYHGLLEPGGKIVNAEATPINFVSEVGDGTYLFEGAIAASNPGLHGYTLRILPQHENLHHPYEPGLIFWMS
ncbi:MAG: alpha-glucan family phosphorylase [Candidatus Poribacteria bacterium]|nr:alpha-glucan family phosphorylase [Candidatus Poribacteria bacterium]